ncbi:MAG: HNH endonuclease [Acidobacteriota bacterium]
MNRSRRQLVLGIVVTDSTFKQVQLDGRTLWQGKCLHCNSPMLTTTDGELLGHASIEHVLPRHHGGGDDLENLALACDSCNQQKGSRHDHRRPDDPRAREVIEKLAAKRMKRWREPPDGS